MMTLIKVFVFQIKLKQLKKLCMKQNFEIIFFFNQEELQVKKMTIIMCYPNYYSCDMYTCTNYLMHCINYVLSVLVCICTINKDYYLT